MSIKSTPMSRQTVYLSNYGITLEFVYNTNQHYGEVIHGFPRTESERINMQLDVLGAVMLANAKAGIDMSSDLYIANIEAVYSDIIDE